MSAPDPIDAHVGRRLGEARTVDKRSRPDVAKVVGISAEQLRKYELAIDRISAGRLLKLAQALGRKVDWFYEGALPEVDAPALAEENSAPEGAPEGKHDRTRRLMSAFRSLSAETQDEVLSDIERRL